MAAEKSATILVVDDEFQILEALEDLLEEEFRVLTASSGPAALELMDRREVWAVLSDQRMPEMKGEEFLAKVADVPLPLGFF